MAIELTDDGTLDTVLRCSDCGEEFRYTFDIDTQDAYDGHSDTAYDAFVEWAIKDATEQHDCALAFDEGAEGEHAARELGELDDPDAEPTQE